MFSITEVKSANDPVNIYQCAFNLFIMLVIFLCAHNVNFAANCATSREELFEAELECVSIVNLYLNYIYFKVL